MDSVLIVKCMIFKFDIPLTKGVPYHKIIRTTDPVAAGHLSKASIARDAMVSLLAKQEPSQALVTAIENYFPYLFGLVVAVEGQAHIRLNDPLAFPWTSALSNNKKSYFTDYTYRYEVVMTLMAYGYTLCNRAWAINETSTDTNFEENSKQAAHFLKSAAGVFDYVHSVELPRWINLPADRPLETMGPVTAALSLMCIASAQELAVKKAVLKGTSKAVITKLSADVWHKYENAIAQLHTLPEVHNNIGSMWKNFLNACMNLQKANTYKVAGQVAMEAGKCGTAVANLQVAMKAVKDVSGGGTLGLWKGMITEQKADIEHFSCLYSKENDLIAFDKVPEEMMLDIPEPKSLMAAVVYNPPMPIFQEIK